MRIFRRFVGICRQVPMLPITILAAIPVALLWNYRPWLNGVVALNVRNFVAQAPSATAWHIGPFVFNPSVGQLIVVLLVAYSVFDSVKGMVASLKAGHVGIDVLAILALLSTVGVQEYWASWAVVLMIWSGEAIEDFAQTKAESNLSALVAAAPQMAHISDLPAADAAKRSAEGFRATSAAALSGSGARELQGDIDAIDAKDCTCELASVASNDNRPARANSSPAHSLGRHTFIGGSLSRGVWAGNSLGAEDGQLAYGARFGKAALTDQTGQAAQGSQDDQVAQAVQGTLVTQGAQTAQGAHFHTVPVNQVKLGDVLMVLPGETIPVDGKLLSGTATLDLSAINGEPLPRKVFAGARVMSGAINGSAMIVIRATQLAEDSQYQQTLQLVDSARSSRAPVVKTADILAVPFTIISLVIGVIAWIVSGTPERFAQVLVLATPCPLLIAAPVAYMAGTGRLAKVGILTKTQEVLENLGKVSHMFFDKTGTLTVTKPQVVRVDVPSGVRGELTERLNVMAGLQERSAGAGSVAQDSRADVNAGAGMDRDANAAQAGELAGAGAADGPAAARRLEKVIVELAAVVETYSVHILAQGIVAAGVAASKQLHHGRAAFPVVERVHEDAGNGVQGEVEGHTVRVGRLGFVATAGETFPEVQFEPRAADEMAAYVSFDGILAARIVLRDVPRSNARESLQRLRSMGIGKVTMLTGDSPDSADAIASEVGIDDVRAGLLPQDKVAAVKAVAGEGLAHSSKIESLLSRLSGQPAPHPISVMVGDGVNDAPVLAAADIGIAMTDGTSTAASQTAQVVIMNDDIADVPKAVSIAHQTKRTMLQAVVAGLTLALVCMVVAAFNLIPVVVGAFMQEAIDVVSILWALTALRDREDR
ncbi:cation transport ATPase [Bifidobacterium commune]|uniref:ATPase, P-type (Transporting), HAD superfamily, subfamily IC n=1 Tax=Bifidobacterium commune TaxID=1505727 RepID=A0A1C4H6W4_9BIFI|nr:HAD-IC family P-type ATPase [Bifidobacterium commune]MBB2955632.1 cation transport ATPase [Bifidobacterium commune]SCC80430.1 ATPase, P-type (transporting), HAD superfamily, subfamily IC [Bifidobacterium commune]